MLKVLGIFGVLAMLGFTASAQTAPQAMAETENEFHQLLRTSEKQAFLKFLGKDGVLFMPSAVNGRDYWSLQKDKSNAPVVRRRRYMDLSASGLLGYTTGSWKTVPPPQSKLAAKFGDYVTIWERGLDGKFRIGLDITIEHDMPTPEDDIASYVTPSTITGDMNPRRWSAADPSMNFFKLSMTKKALGGAYDRWAGQDVRLLLEGELPIEGKARVVKATREFISIDYPKKTSLLESADLAYIWNPCEYANSDEGKEKGNCLHIWKLRNKKYYITLGVLSRVRNMTKPTIKVVHPKKG